MKKIPVTKEGLIELKKKLDILKTVDRKNVISAVKTAREHGDLKENAEYHAAKEEQFLIEKKIKELEEKIFLANEIDISSIKDVTKIMFGATVNIRNLSTDLLSKYKLVGEDEADIKNNKISINSPLARVLILKSKNDVVNLDTLSGLIKYRIEDIKYI
ncbi:MAG TPA: transcription elongation factor GreA [Candidatus Azoamicus sp. MARI]